MSAKVFWQTLLVCRAARTMLCMTSRFLRHIWNWSGTNPASSRQWWLSFQATPLPLSVSPLRGEDGYQWGERDHRHPSGDPAGEGEPQKGGTPKGGHWEGVHPPPHGAACYSQPVDGRGEPQLAEKHGGGGGVTHGRDWDPDWGWDPSWDGGCSVQPPPFIAAGSTVLPPPGEGNKGGFGAIHSGLGQGVGVEGGGPAVISSHHP